MNRNERPISGPGTIIGSNVHLTGTLRDMGDVAVHGNVEGEIISERAIIIGETAEIKGPVTGQVITLGGIVRGSIEASQKLEILPTGKLFGSITTKELIIRSGAIFIGKSTMPVEDLSAAEAPKEDNETEDRAFQAVSRNAEVEDEEEED